MAGPKNVFGVELDLALCVPVRGTRRSRRRPHAIHGLGPGRRRRPKRGRLNGRQSGERPRTGRPAAGERRHGLIRNPTDARRPQHSADCAQSNSAGAHWIEPKDQDLEKVDAKQQLSPADEARFLPAWARGPIPERVDGSSVTVRRVADPGDSTVVTSLHRALDGQSGGTTLLADEGPLSVEDFRIAGETRLIRARAGFRSILRIDRSGQAAVREQPAVVVLKGKNLTLDGIDLIVDPHELSRSQTALFQCTGANLTLRNCTITILNGPAGTAFTLVKAAGTGARPTHVRIERCLIRGAVAEGFRLTGGGCEVVVRDSVVLAGGGPLVRVDGADATSDNRMFLVQSMVAGPGPIIEWIKKPVGRPAKALDRAGVWLGVRAVARCWNRQRDCLERFDPGRR